MSVALIHRFEWEGRRFAVDTETCFCFECDAVSWDVLAHYPEMPVNGVYHALAEKYPRKELEEVIGELEWLRATKSILPAPKREELLKQFEVERGVRHVSVALPEVGGAERLVRQACTLLFARSAHQKALELEVIVSGATSVKGLATACAEALKTAKMTGKSFTVSVRVESPAIAKLPDALSAHDVAFQLNFRDVPDIETHLAAIAGGRAETLARYAKRLGGGEGPSGRAILTPGNGAIAPAVEALAEAGFHSIALDLEAALVRNPQFDLEGMVNGLSETAQWYAARLLKHQYLRLDPIASIFWRIYNGTPIKRADISGTQGLHVTAKGHIYPSRLLASDESFLIGNCFEGLFDEERAGTFEDLGVVTTPACMRCWARHLCGGGPGAVHHARTGSIATPDPAWCDAQRTWLSLSVSAFNTLSSQGVNFSRMYNVLDGQKRPSLFTLARAAFRMTIGMRPLAESDAGMLATWENWNRSAYFLLNERATLIGNMYEREMDAIHPRAGEYEVVLVRKSGEPFGLFKVRPDKTPDVAEGFIYLRAESDYTDTSIQKGFAAIVKEATGQHSFRRLIVYAAPWESGLQTFLVKTGFHREGELREALYARGTYSPCLVYSLTF